MVQFLPQSQVHNRAPERRFRLSCRPYRAGMANRGFNGGTPIAGWFVPWKIHLQMDDLGVPLFQETSIWPIVSFNCGQFRIAKGSSEEIVAILQHSSTFVVGG